MDISVLSHLTPTSHPNADGLSCHAPPVPVAALQDIATGLARVERSIPPSPEDNPALLRSLRLIATDDYDVWLLVWPAGSKISGHDHAGATSVISMVTGSLIEFLETTSRSLRPGISTITPPHAPHRLWNPAVTEAKSIHVYSPPLADITFRPSPITRPDPAIRRPTRTASLGKRPAEATSAAVT